MKLSRLVYALVYVLAALVACGPAAPTDQINAPTDPAAKARSYVVAGTLVGHDGKPMKLAHVHAGETTVAAAADGRYRLELPGAGFYPVEFTGVDHGSYTVGMLVDGTEVKLDVALGTYSRPERFGDVVMLVYKQPPGDNPRPSTRNVAMTRQADGRFTAEVEHEGEELIYQLANAVAVGRTVNGTQADRYSYDGGGDYVSHVAMSGSKITVTFDPKQLILGGVEPDLAFADPASPAARIAALHHEHKQRQQRVIAAAVEQGVMIDKAVLDIDMSWRGKLAAAIAEEQHPQVRAVQLLAYFGLAPLLAKATAEQQQTAKRLAERALSEIPADSAVWQIEPGHITGIVDATGEPERHAGYIDDMIAHLPDTAETARFMVNLMSEMERKGRDGDVARYFTAFKKRFGHLEIGGLAMRFDPSRQVRPGKPLPDFELISFDDGVTRITRDSLRGKTVLIEVWATWCKPCVAEMPKLHALHDKYRDREFALLSVAINDSADNVRKFREKWAMPWLNVVLDEDSADMIRKRFEIVGVPRTIVVDPSGTITAVDLRGDALALAVKRALLQSAASR